MKGSNTLLGKQSGFGCVRSSWNTISATQSRSMSKGSLSGEGGLEKGRRGHLVQTLSRKSGWLECRVCPALHVAVTSPGSPDFNPKGGECEATLADSQRRGLQAGQSREFKSQIQTSLLGEGHLEQSDEPGARGSPSPPWPGLSHTLGGWAQGAWPHGSQTLSFRPNPDHLLDGEEGGHGNYGGWGQQEVGYVPGLFLSHMDLFSNFITISFCIFIV